MEGGEGVGCSVSNLALFRSLSLQLFYLQHLESKHVVTYPVLIHSLWIGEVDAGDEMVNVAAAHPR